MADSSQKTKELAPESQGNQSLLDDRWIRLVDSALKAQAPVAEAYVRGLIKKNPHASREQLLDEVGKKFTNLLTVTGAGIGGAAALPGVGTAAALGLTVGEGVAFAEACAFLTLAAATIYDVDIRNDDTRYLLMMSVLSGERGAEIIAKAMGKQGLQWNALLGGGSNPATSLVNKQVKKWVQRTMVARSGGLLMGKILPFGLGAAVGGAGNRFVAKSVLDAVRGIFQQAPIVQGTISEQ